MGDDAIGCFIGAFVGSAIMSSLGVWVGYVLGWRRGYGARCREVNSEVVRAFRAPINGD